MDREDARLAAQMAHEFISLLSLLPTVASGAPAGEPEPPEVADASERMDSMAAEIKARRERNGD